MAFTSPQDTQPEQSDARSDLDKLWDTEFGDAQEVVVRCIGIAGGGLALWIYNGAVIGPLWAIVYFLALFTNYRLLRPRPAGTPRSVTAGYVTFLISLAVYLSLPIYVMIAGDPLMVFCGAMGLIAYAVFTLYRPAPPGLMEHVDIAIAWLLASVAAITFLPLAPSLFPKAVMVFLCAMMAVYYSMSVRQTRAARAEFQRATKRSVEAQKMEAIGRLSGGIAHDFNNILTALQGSLELYYEVPEGQERDALVDEAREAGIRATALVAQLLSFARRAPLETGAHNANAVLDDLRMLAQRLLPAGIQLNLRVVDGPACVLADASGLRSALLNLILNANDAMNGQGAITLAVDMVEGPAREANATLALTPDNAHLCFSVADDGPGMSAEVEHRAVEPFFTTKAVGKGSGLGLPMAMGFAEQSGGALRIKSSPDGTTVALHLPMCDKPWDTDGQTQ
ncbi:sensor histidine kinase [Jannaschia sp. CCS1]|uniref:sensor histidine kinase n=1 Tax=Jannaschia sp. (strain CCS1) TaxID=290400 RepID=UPI000053B126|nr:ATP-binding protein [Jannaschia sp. CCS1]ABD54713.1 periplasmic sensor signal transduction histidine kinase [Jannaschia sp. CCS1]